MAGDTGMKAGPDGTALLRGAAIRLAPYLRSALVVAVATLAAMLIEPRLELPNLSLVFLIGVLFCAVSYGLGPSLFASALSVATYDFFFLPPLYSLNISDPTDVLAAIAFLISAVLVSNLAARTREQATIAQHRADVMADLYSYSTKLAGIAKLEDLGKAATRQIATMLKVDAVLLLPEGDQLAARFAYPPDRALGDADLAAAREAWLAGRIARRDVDATPQPERWFFPLRTERDAIGLLAVDRDRHQPALTPDERRLLDALANQTAVALERIRLAENIDQARLVAETERLRSALLRSISHDLRTPLTMILGAVTSLQAYGADFDPPTRDELTAMIREEAERLNRFVGNLLDMTRLESGALELKRSLADLDDVLGAALRRCATVLAQHRVTLDLAPDLPPLDLDFTLFEQVLVNLLDNAAKYAPAGSTIEITARTAGGQAVIEIADQGPGIPPDDLERIFDQFYRVRAGDQQCAGTGLGLAICRGFVEALGGRIVARNRPERTGAVLAISLPIPAARALPADLDALEALAAD
jgi:two-component system sensor histidine kinase KdpD